MSRMNEALERAKTAWSVHNSADRAGEVAETPWRFDGPPALEPPPGSRARSAEIPDAALRASPETVAQLAATPSLLMDVDPAVEERMVVSRSMPHIAVEQYRRLAAKLHHSQLERGTKRVLITSAVAGEGKSLTATNLALTLSQSYRRKVLLIDGDLRRPTLHQLFHVEPLTGLVDGLRSATERPLPLIAVSERLSLLPAGRPDPDPMSVLSSDRMRRVLDEASLRFDWIIVDSPPVALLPDANLLAAMVDTALIVVRAGYCSFDLVQRAVDAIGRQKIMGVVMNRMEDVSLGNSEAYHSYYERFNDSAS